MELSNEIKNFIQSPDTLDFIVRSSDYLDEFIKENPNITITQTLSGRYIIGYIDKSHYDDLLSYLSTSFISSAPVILGTLDRPPLDSAGIIPVHNQPYLDLKGRGVLVGIVDTGIDYMQKSFIYEDGTSKIKFIYDQTAEGDPPDGFFFGHEYNNEQINSALSSENPHDIVPEHDKSGHGTFLASVAAGREIDDFSGAAPEADIIAVKLKKARPFYLEKFCVPDQQEYAFESSAVMVGIEYIIKKAHELKRPVVICLGLGTNFGSHDGFSIFEEYLSGISNLKGVCICNAAGNECQERHHTSGKLNTVGETQNVDVRVGSNAGNICISLWNTVSDRLSVSIRSPSGELVGRVPAKAGTSTEVKLVLENTRVTVEYYMPLEGSGGQLTVVRILDATPGIWTIIVHGDIILNGVYHSWLPMSGFVSTDVEFLSASPYYTTTIPGTAIGTICCGAYNSLSQSLYQKSSWGPSRAEVTLPDLVAPGVNIGGYFPYGFGQMSGTSAAAAITSGACALLMQWGIVNGNDVSLSTYQIRAYLIRGCVKSIAMDYPNEQWGYGTLNLMQSFHLMREL